jgi:hypothetical protein
MEIHKHMQIDTAVSYTSLLYCNKQLCLTLNNKLGGGGGR